MRSPLSGSSVGCGFSHSIGTKASCVGLIYIPLGWGHPFGQVCFAYTLDHDRRIAFSCWFLFLQVGVTCWVLLLAPCFPWLGIVVCLCATLFFVAEKKKKIKKKNNKANWMVSYSAKLDSRTKQHTQFGVSASNGSRDMAATKSWRKKIKNKK